MGTQSDAVAGAVTVAAGKSASKNKLFLSQFNSAIAGFSRAALISTGAAAFEAAVRTAWQDSGRAAHNLNLAAGANDFTEDYNRVRGVPPVGKTRELRSQSGNEGEVIEERFRAYEIRPGGPVAFSGYLKEKVGDPNEKRIFFGYQLGYGGAKVRTVSVYSPIGMKFGTYPVRAYYSSNRSVTVKEAMAIAVSEQREFLRQELKGARTKEQIASFLARNY